MDALINVTNLGKRYDGFHLEDIGLAVEAGTVVGLIGFDRTGERPPRSRCCSAPCNPMRVKAKCSVVRSEKACFWKGCVKERIGVVLDTCAFP